MLALRIWWLERKGRAQHERAEYLALRGSLMLDAHRPMLAAELFKRSAGCIGRCHALRRQALALRMGKP